ncbi:PepSY-associated TM helix domain-containing protein [uncultured Algimonas sp.]|uniref:PepSY-associated TM helix domain-containing protein n=1 Tax=uncultured Algimonas sp. TaxID=1547920 RepID=UPI0026305B9A|nr:PepSY-associated TM helix domain-containing protein [uncultured Algimonas sp.]
MPLARDRHKRLYGLHSWSGILFAWFLFVVCWSGTAAVFVEDIVTFEDPTLRHSVPADATPDIDADLRAAHAELSALGRIDYLIVDFPRDRMPFYWIRGGAVVEGEGLREIERKFHPGTGAPLPVRGDGAAHWILEFHTDLMLPNPLGRTLVGLAGIVLGLAAITGLFIHGKLIREFFTLRLMRSQRLKWQDSHKLLGVITLPFSAMIAFTGAYLGIIAILAPIIAVIAFKGDTDALVEAVVGAPLEPVGQQVAMISLSDIQAMRVPGLEDGPYRVIANHYGDAAARFDVLFFETEDLATTQIHPVGGATGAPVDAPRLTDPGPANRIVNALSPLHFGTYGGMALKWIYGVLGLGLCIMTALGTMLWIERRRYGSEGTKSDRFYEALSRMNIGICLGFPAATIGLLGFDALYAGAEAARTVWTGTAYFGLVLLTVLFALLHTDGYAAVRRGLWGLAGLAVISVTANLAVHGWPSGRGDVQSVMACLIGLAALTALSARWLPQGRPTIRKRVRRVATDETGGPSPAF